MCDWLCGGCGDRHRLVSGWGRAWSPAAARPSSWASSAGRIFVAALAVVAVDAVIRADVVIEDVEPLLRLDLPGHTGEVRALAFSADSTRLISGGRDKLAIVWQLAEQAGADPALRERDVFRRRLRERVIRWQIARGPRGAIQSLAVSPGGDPPIVAVGGLGAMAGNGEIILVDARDGTWIKTLGGVTRDGVERPGHRQAVTALEFTADGSWLVSQDLDGQAFAWKRADGWTAVELTKREEERFGAAGAQALRRTAERVRPLATVGNDRVAIPVLVSRPDANKPVWKIRMIDLSRPADQGRLLPLEHYGVITSLAVAPAGRRIVSGDQSGRVALIDPTGSTPATVWDVTPMAETLAVLPDGKRIVVGVAAGLSPPSPPRLEVWEASPPRRITTRTVAAPVRALRASADGRWLAWSGDERHAVMLESTESLGKQESDVPPEARQKLGGVGQRISRLAFSKAAADARLLEKPREAGESKDRPRNIIRRQQPRVDGRAATAPRRIAVARGPREDGRPAPAFAEAFDVQGLAVSAVGQPEDWAPAEGKSGRWAIRPDSRPVASQSPGLERWELLLDGRRAGVIDLELDWQGPAGSRGTAVSWLSQENSPEPWAVAVGTDLGIFVYRLDEAAGATCKLVRWFRGNENRLLSLAVSEDGRWLASGGADGIAMLWSLAGIDRNAPLQDRWGVTIAVENGRAIVKDVDEAGPLAGKDVRPGDVVAKISFRAGKTDAIAEHAAGNAVATGLAEAAWNTSVSFTVERDGNARQFNRNPAWENIAALHLMNDGEWALWSPRGYYAASDNGDRSFGWIVNRGIDRLPRFFRANQFRRTLERPDVVAKLLVEGSLGAALRAAGRDVPDSAARVLPEQIDRAPKVKILSPAADLVAQGGRLVVRAEIEDPNVGELDRVQAFASGVTAAAPPRIVDDVAAQPGQPRRRVYEWELDLPSQDRQLINVFAATRGGPTTTEGVAVAAVAPPPAARRMHVIAAGVGVYANAEKWRSNSRALGFQTEDDAWDLKFPVQDASAVRDALASRSLDLYTLGSEPQLLAGAALTRAAWKEAVAKLASDLRSRVRPDDIVVIFLAGHGVRRLDAGDTYAYLCHDAELKFLTSRRGDEEVLVPEPTSVGAIGWADLQPIADLPCRKLALVDTCHSGSLDPVSRQGVREFQENMFAVLAAAAADQPSLEYDEWGHGAFTKALLEGLGAVDGGHGPAHLPADNRGAAGQTAAASGPDGIVSLDELVAYVATRVPELTAPLVDPSRGERPQRPQSSPQDLLGYVDPPLVKAGADGRR